MNILNGSVASGNADLSTGAGPNMAGGIPRTPDGAVDIGSIAAMIADAGPSQNDTGVRAAIEAQLTPVERGQLAAALAAEPDVFVPTAQSRDAASDATALEAKGLVTEQDIAWARQQTLATVSSGATATHHLTQTAFDKAFLANLETRMQARLDTGEVRVGDNARALAPGEVAVIRRAYGDTVNLDHVRIVTGDGGNLVAAGAFRNGNPAITIGDTIYLKVGQRNLSSTPEGIRTLIHETSHVQQYQEKGIAAVWSQVIWESRGGQDDAYHYFLRDNAFANETLEAQSAIRGDYGAFRETGTLPTYSVDGQKRQVSAGELNREASGSGIYGR